MNRYRKLEKAVGGGLEMCGDGAYGEVYKALDLETQKLVALKRLKSNADDNGLPAHAIREFTLLKALQTVGHPNVITLENVLLENCRIYLAFELMDGDLKKQMNSLPAPHCLPPSLARAYCQQVLAGLAFVHSRGVMHRDLKPQNLLVTRNSADPCGFTIKIADFGLARSFTPNPRPLSLEVITRWYRPPEILMGCANYSCSVDMWSMACILAEMTSGSPLFQSTCDIDQLHHIFCLLGTPTEQSWPGFTSLPYYRNTFPQWPKIATQRVVPRLSPEGLDFIERIFQYQPNKRLTAVEALMHPYVRSPPPSPQQHSRGGSVANAEIGTNGCRCAQSDDSQEKQTEDSQNEENAATSQPPPANAAFQFPLSSALLTRSASYKSLSHVVANDDDGDISKIGKQEGEGAGHVPTVYKKRKGFASDGEDTAVCSNGVKDDGRVRTADDDREECSIGRSTRSTRSKTVSTLPSSSSSAVSGHDSADNSRIASSSSSSTQLRRKRRSGGGGGDDDEVSGRPPLPRPAAAATSQRGNKK